SEHVELACLGPRSLRVAAALDGVGAVALGGHHLRGPGPEGGLHAVARAGARVPCSSWSETTSGSPRWAAMIARAAARPPDIVVTHGIPRLTAAERISYPSERARVPVGVLMTRSTAPRSIQSTTWSGPSLSLLICVAEMPMRLSDWAVPR